MKLQICFFLLMPLFANAAAPSNAANKSVRAPAPATPGFPLCHRPLDFTLGKDVAAYEACYTARAHFCDTHEKSKDCIALRKELSLVRADKKIKDPNPDERCMIRQDGSYFCHQEPIRFLSLNPQSVAPEPPTTITPISPGLGMPDMKMPGAGGRKAGVAPAPGASAAAPSGGLGTTPSTGSTEEGTAPTEPVPPLDLLGPKPGGK